MKKLNPSHHVNSTGSPTALWTPELEVVQGGDMLVTPSNNLPNIVVSGPSGPDGVVSVDALPRYEVVMHGPQGVA
jgi:hypothetical protein